MCAPKKTSVVAGDASTSHQVLEDGVTCTAARKGRWSDCVTVSQSKSLAAAEKKREEKCKKDPVSCGEDAALEDGIPLASAREMAPRIEACNAAWQVRARCSHGRPLCLH
jgi:hypothetical protein